VVPQLYLAFPQISGSGEQAIEQEPPRQLKAFQKLTLDPVGASTTVTMEISAQARAIWDVDTHAWKPITGTFLLEVGSSSADIRVNQLVQVGKGRSCSATDSAALSHLACTYSAPSAQFSNTEYSPSADKQKHPFAASFWLKHGHL
jgi:hypothetical protein